MSDKTKKKLHTEAAENHSRRVLGLKSFFSCKHHHGCTRSIFNLKDHTNTNTNTSLVESPKKRVFSMGSGSRSSSSRSLKAPLSEINGGSFRGMHLRRLSGCYECHMVVDPLNNGFSKVPSLRSTISPCPDCGEVFKKPESLELHQGNYIPTTLFSMPIMSVKFGPKFFSSSSRFDQTLYSAEKEKTSL